MCFDPVAGFGARVPAGESRRHRLPTKGNPWTAQSYRSAKRAARRRRRSASSTPPRRCSWSTASRRRACARSPRRPAVNLAAVNYHFGSKEELFQAVLTRRLDPMNQERVDAARRASRRERRPAPLPLRADPRRAVHPGARARARPAARRQELPAPARAAPTPIRRRSSASSCPSSTREMIARFKAAFGRALPHLPREELSWRLHFIMGALSYTLAGTDALKLIAELNPRRDRQRRAAAAAARAVPARRADRAAARSARRRALARRASSRPATDESQRPGAFAAPSAQGA